MRSIYLLSILLLYISCLERPAGNAGSNGILKKKNKIICDDKIRFKQLALSLVSLNDLAEYPNVAERLKKSNSIVIVDDSIIAPLKIDIIKSASAKFMSIDSIRKRKINYYLHYREIRINSNSAHVVYILGTTNTQIESTYIFRDCNWILKDSNLSIIN